ncbi:tryptophan-rich sensory protein [Agromyces fucosus]|uniref:Tryptophan-rich sensory protein n=1 Tax=Agromyces fucosus TaxID=41985 RepID=A0A4Q2JKZ2_9MICO|nr:TspO/MBR family protein [Agromyces fucosus]RXZ48791.1 tryptophan-rich sensory protein [Agromyces fucosus]
MTSTSAELTTPRGDLARQITVAVSAALAVIGAFIGSGAAGGTPVQDASGGALAADATLLAPGGGAFSIWSVIYVGLVAYAVWQFLPAQRAAERQRRLGYLVAASLVLNAAWILSIQFDQLALSVPVIVALLVVLILAFRICRATRPAGPVDAVLTDGTIGLYLGWVSVATAANITAVLVAAGFDGWGLAPEVWAIGVLAVVGIIGVWLAVWDRGRIAPTISLAWGLSWIAAARLTDAPPSTPTAVAAIAAAAAIVIATIWSRLATMRARSTSA